MTTYEELRADLDTMTGLLHELEARMAVRIKEHARMKTALEYYADGHNWLIRGDGSQAATRDQGKTAREVLDSLKQEKP